MISGHKRVVQLVTEVLREFPKVSHNEINTVVFKLSAKAFSESIIIYPTGKHQSESGRNGSYNLTLLV